MFVTWSGGEPLIEFNRIEELSKEIISFCRKNNIKFESNIITNAVLLNKHIVKNLQNINLTSIQVSIEPTEILDSINRPIKDTGKSNFYNTYENVKSVAGMITIVFRIALSRKNYNSVVDFVKKLKIDDLFSKKVNFALGPLHIPFLNPNLNYSILSDVLDSKEYAKKYFNIYEELFDNGIIDFVPYPGLYNECGAYKNNVFSIDAAGNVFKCFENVFDKSEAIGSVKDEKLYFTYKHTNWVKEDFDFEKLECYHCKLLPVCKGGCNMVRRFKKETHIGNFIELGCNEWKYGYEQGLKLHYKSIKRNEKNSFIFNLFKNYKIETFQYLCIDLLLKFVNIASSFLLMIFIDTINVGNNFIVIFVILYISILTFSCISTLFKSITLSFLKDKVLFDFREIALSRFLNSKYEYSSNLNRGSYLSQRIINDIELLNNLFVEPTFKSISSLFFLICLLPIFFTSNLFYS